VADFEVAQDFVHAYSMTVISVILDHRVDIMS